MAYPENKEAEVHAQFENFNDWVCSICFKGISASRPPIFNGDNCSCNGVADFHIGNNNGYYPEPAAYEDQLYNPNVAAPVYNQAQSVASSSASVPCLEAPEHANLNLQADNNYIPPAPTPGLNETQHQRTASFNSDMSYPLQRFLGEMKTHGVYETEAVDRTTTSTSNSRFLSQEIHLQSSKITKRGSPHSKMSWVSGSEGSGDASVESWGMDPLAGAGMWANADTSGYANTGAYAMVLSGTTDCAVFDDEEMN